MLGRTQETVGTPPRFGSAFSFEAIRFYLVLLRSDWERVCDGKEKVPLGGKNVRQIAKTKSKDVEPGLHARSG